MRNRGRCIEFEEKCQQSFSVLIITQSSIPDFFVCRFSCMSKFAQLPLSFLPLISGIILFFLLFSDDSLLDLSHNCNTCRIRTASDLIVSPSSYSTQGFSDDIYVLVLLYMGMCAETKKYFLYVSQVSREYTQGFCSAVFCPQYSSHIIELLSLPSFFLSPFLRNLPTVETTKCCEIPDRKGRRKW